jgi:DNA-binding CsgD family transcriptional regulator
MNDPIYNALCSAFDQMSIAVFLLSQEAKLLFVNAAGEAMLLQGWPVCSTNEYLHGMNRAASEQLQRGMSAVLAHTKKGAPNSGHFELCLGRVAEEKPGAIGYLRGLSGMDAADPIVALFIASKREGKLYGTTALAESFGLSVAEARVLEQVIEVHTPSKVAERLSLSVYTVKSHMRKIFQKTGTARQVELLHLIESFRIPLRDAKSGEKNGGNGSPT